MGGQWLLKQASWRFWPRVLAGDLPPICFRVVSLVPQNGFIGRTPELRTPLWHSSAPQGPPVLTAPAQVFPWARTGRLINAGYQPQRTHRGPWVLVCGAVFTASTRRIGSPIGGEGRWASTILGAFEEAQTELVGKAVILTNGRAGTVQHVWLDELHGLLISIGGHHGKWPVSEH